MKIQILLASGLTVASLAMLGAPAGAVPG